MLNLRIVEGIPGVMLAATVTLMATGIERAERHFLGDAWLDALVLSILVGTGINTAFGLHPRLRSGVRFASKTFLEIAIVLLGASLSFAMLAQIGGPLILSVAIIVFLSLIIGYLLARSMGLPDKLATLVACGNSICGNSAIAAAAPVIDAKPEDVASSISFTAVLGILVVLLLPFVFRTTGMSQFQYGILAGMTVYAVPQVLGATVPVGAISVQIGTVVKLMRVLMLGPVVILLGLRGQGLTGHRPTIKNMLPWFIIGFVAMMGLRSLDLIPEIAIGPIRTVSAWLTIVSMAALGLSVDLRSVMKSGGRILAAGVLSLLILASMSVLMLALL